MNRLTTTLVLLLIVASGVGLYQLKYKTRQLQKEVTALDRQLAADREAIRVLEAEWTYLTRPERVAALASRYLALEPTSGLQVLASVNRVERRADTSVRLAQVDDFRSAPGVLARGPVMRPAIPDPRPGALPVTVAEAKPAPEVTPAPLERGSIVEARSEPRREEELFERIRLVLMEGGND